MSPSGKIINFDAFAKKESGLKSSKSAQYISPVKRLGNNGLALALGAFVVACLTLFMMPSKKASIEIPPAGSVAPYNIKAPEEMVIEDQESTEKKREQAQQATLDVYDFDSRAAATVTAKINNAFALVANGYKANVKQAYEIVIANMGKGAPVVDSNSEDSANNVDLINNIDEAKRLLVEFEKSDDFKKLEKEFSRVLGASIDEKSLETLRHYHYWHKIGIFTGNIISPILNKNLVADKNGLPLSSSKGVTIRDLSTNVEKFDTNMNTMRDIASAAKIISSSTEKLAPKQPPLKNLVATLSQALISPNLTFNRKETDLRKEASRVSVNPVFFRVQRGEMIVREGELVTPLHVTKLENLSEKVEDSNRISKLVGTIVLNALLIALVSLFIWKYHEEARESPKMQILLALLLVTHIGLVWASANIFTMFINQTPGIPMQSYILAAPLIFGSLIVSIYFTAELTVLFTIVAAILTGLMLKDYPILILLTVTGGMICSFAHRSYFKRTGVMKVGLLVAMVNILVVFSFNMVNPAGFAEEGLYDYAFAILGASLAALFASGALPVIESAFPVVSDIKLLELTNLNHPLLRQMILKAPGSYHHSMMVGNLAEEACKAIGANALLARAGALFHDIGKMKKSNYFVENQKHNDNPHDHLSPSMSALIVMNHVKGGLELAKQYKLLPQIAAMIPEHHGTQLIRVFYHKAKMAEDVSREEVREEDYRYPGPIPSSRESACVALADSVEASTRACQEPTVERLREIVTEAINDKFIQGQLDNSHLTLHDLALIADSFVNALKGIHHHRLQYPEQEAKRNGKHAGSDSKTERGQDAESL